MSAQCSEEHTNQDYLPSNNNNLPCQDCILFIVFITRSLKNTRILAQRSGNEPFGHISVIIVVIHQIYSRIIIDIE